MSPSALETPVTSTLRMVLRASGVSTPFYITQSNGLCTRLHAVDASYPTCIRRVARDYLVRTPELTTYFSLFRSPPCCRRRFHRYTVRHVSYTIQAPPQYMLPPPHQASTIQKSVSEVHPSTFKHKASCECKGPAQPRRFHPSCATLLAIISYILYL